MRNKLFNYFMTMFAELEAIAPLNHAKRRKWKEKWEARAIFNSIMIVDRLKLFPSFIVENFPSFSSFIVENFRRRTMDIQNVCFTRFWLKKNVAKQFFAYVFCFNDNVCATGRTCFCSRSESFFKCFFIKEAAKTLKF